jgi:hypothetical protein
MNRLAAALAVALAALALVETAVALTAPARAPAAADWEAAAAEVRAAFADGDLIVFAPAWADQVGRAHLEVPVEMAGRADADRYRRVWEVSIRGAHAPEAAGARLVRQTRHGRVTVALFEKPSVTVGYDFTARLDEARVTQVYGSDEQPCYRDGPGFHCAGTRIERRTLEVDYRPHRGILCPAVAARTTRIEFAEVPLGAQLVGYTGLHDYYSRKNADGPVDLRVFIDGRERLAVRHQNRDGWRRFSVDTRGESGGAHRVRFEVSAPQPAWRTFGFHAETRL